MVGKGDRRFSVRRILSGSMYSHMSDWSFKPLALDDPSAGRQSQSVDDQNYSHISFAAATVLFRVIEAYTGQASGPDMQKSKR